MCAMQPGLTLLPYHCSHHTIHRPPPAEKSFIAWQGSRPKQLHDLASSLLPAASHLAQQSWRRVSRLFSASEVEVRVRVRVRVNWRSRRACERPLMRWPRPEMC